MRIRILCLFAALLAAAPVLWVGPANAAGSIIHAHGENRGPGGSGDHAGDEDDDDDDDAGQAPPAAGGAEAQGVTPGTAAPAAVAGPAAVSIVDGGFQPAAVSVAAGSQVTWSNTDGSRHTVTAENGAFDSGSLSTGGVFSFTFPSPGTFAYFCAFHSEMQGTVTVPGPATKPSAAVAPKPTSTTVTTAAAGADATGATVEARDYEFTPSRLTVGRGTEVTFRNSGQAPHTATGDTFDSGELVPGQRFAKRFDTPGTYEYRCELHPRMQGVVEVVADATAEPVAAEVKRFPLERVAAGGIVGAPVLLLAGSALLWRRRSG